MLDLFTEIGAVAEVFLPADRNTGRPRGFAFVTFEDSDSVATAIEKLDGHDLKGRGIRISEAEDRPPRRAPNIDFNSPPPDGGGFRNRPKPKGSRRNMRGKKRRL